MQTVFGLVRKVAPTTAPVLILGESGSGKEMVAQALHRCSPQRNGPFAAINCSAIPETLLESELFGHEKGAFTGAHTQRKGLIERPQGGTLFLDEIGDLPTGRQVKLLRFLQEKRFQRVGGRQEMHSNARVIAATNVNLKESVRAGRSVKICTHSAGSRGHHGAALRERGDDINLIAREFLSPVWRGARANAAWPLPRTPCARSTCTSGRATSASCRTAFSGPSSWLRGNG